MSQDTATPAAPETGYSEEQAAQEILSRMQRKPEADAPADEQESPAGEADEPPAEQADEAQAEASEEDAAETEWEIEFGGQKYKAPKGTPEDLARQVQEFGANLHKDYTRKTQEIAETKKAIEQERAVNAELTKLTHDHADLVADFRVVQRQIDSLSQTDWDALSETDPLTAQKQMARLMQLQHAQQGIGARLQQTIGDMTARQTAAQKEALEKAQAEVAKSITGWGPDKATALRQYGQSQGFSDTELASVADARFVKLLHKAQQFDALQQAKPGVTKRVSEVAKVVKPSAATAQTENKVRADQALAQLRKSGKVDDAASVILARLKRR